MRTTGPNGDGQAHPDAAPAGDHATPHTAVPGTAQSFAAIAPYTIEEACEVADAIAADDLPALREELGNLLFKVVYHARLAEEAGAFGFAQVAGTIADKMVRRHRHVFGNDAARAAGAQAGAWERQKAAERASRIGTGALAGVPARADARRPRRFRLARSHSRAGQAGL